MPRRLRLVVDRRGYQCGDLDLEWVSVLELVDEEVFVSPVHFGSDRRAVN